MKFNSIDNENDEDSGVDNDEDDQKMMKSKLIIYWTISNLVNFNQEN